MVAEPTLETTPIPGLLVLHLPVHEDSRGWFKENWQREKMVALGLPDFGPVQNNVALSKRGVTRGVHAEPWDKYVSVAHGKVFAAWVDLREGDSFGTTFHIEIDPRIAVFVPRGVGNAYQALEDGTAYTYLVNEHWRNGVAYAAVNLGDGSASIPWPIPLDQAEVSEKDQQNPMLDEVEPMAPSRTLILGRHGQLGRALTSVFPEAHGVGIDELDLTESTAVDSWPWGEYDVVLNAAAYTAVDEAESDAGRVEAWQVNASLPAQLARLAAQHRFTLVHYSTDYVFDGTVDEHTESEPLSPLGVYAQTKAAGDLAVGTAPRHYVLRTSWVVGDGANFVRTMRSLAERGECPNVVDDQIGRLTFATELARATRHLLEVQAPYGTYNMTNSGSAASWAHVAEEVFRLCGRDANDVSHVTTQEYAEGRQLAPRPASSVLSLAKIRATGFSPEDAFNALADYLKRDNA
jgi:dTDP-4-dehydrorhamnose 3,5-epimerase